MSICPSDETLDRLGHDSLDGAQWAAVEVHIQDCVQCLESLEKLVSDESAPASLPGGEHLPQIAGFVIEGEIGRGGMGVVYRASEPKLARTVALKIVPSGPLTGPRERKRWLSEAQCVTRVSHPNIVKIHDADECDGWLYLVLEFVPGGSLKERLRGPVPPCAAAEFMKPVAAAMTAVHAAGLLHLDLKPSNILLDSAPDAPWKDACPRVADFGIARPQAGSGSNATSLAGPWGTPSYMAPEQIAANRALLGPATDVYALGAILYELLTGRPPFLAASPIETFDQVRNAEPASPRSLNPGVPRDLDTICLRCLHKDPRKRYPSAEALGDEVNRFLEGRPIKARQVSPIGHAWRWCRRQPVVAILAAALFLTVMGSFLGLLAMLRRAETQRSRSEANYQAASQSLSAYATLFGKLYINGYKPGDELNQYRALLETARVHELELARRHTPDAKGVKRLGFVNQLLANCYVHDGKMDSAVSIMEEAIEISDSHLAHSSGDEILLQQRAGAAAWVSAFAIDRRNYPLFDRWDARAIGMINELKLPPSVHVQSMLHFSRIHRRHAAELMVWGESDRARKVLEDEIKFVRSGRVEMSVAPALALSEALALAALGQWSGEFTSRQSSSHSQQVDVDNGLLEEGLVEMAARRCGWLPSMARSSWLIPEDLSAEAWADRVVLALKADIKQFGLDHNRMPAMAWNMRGYWDMFMNSQQNAGNFRDADRLANQVLALGRRLTHLYPDQAASAMVLSEACIQNAKNAYHKGDTPASEHWERKALDAANHAATLDPENEEARTLVKDRRDRCRVEDGLAEMAARRCGWLPSTARSSLIPEGLSTEAWVDQFISSLRADAARVGVNHTRIPAIGWKMRQYWGTMMPSHRKSDNLREARQLADQVLALGDRLTRLYPDQATPSMFLSEACVQNAKNAYQVDDAPSAERWERKALDAAIRAAALEPENDEARALVKDRRQRLNRLLLNQ